jgi:glycosyltransferase involved in cell wall biosynthesis
MVVEKFSAVRHRRSELRRIGYAGRLWDGKNVDLVLRLFDEIAASNPALELHLAGDGPLRPELEAQAARSPHASRIKFHGYVSDVPAFYADMDLFVFLSAYESFGNVIAEALVTGLPPLTSNVPVFSEIFGKDSEFMLGDPADYETLKQRFLQAVSNFPRLAAKAWEISPDVEAQCSLQNHLHQIEKIYEKY